jgi:hypothetical protein
LYIASASPDFVSLFKLRTSPLSLWERVGVRVITGLLQYLLPLIPTFSQGEKESFVNNHIDFQITTVLNKPNP